MVRARRLLALGWTGVLAGCLHTTEPAPVSAAPGAALDALRAQYGAPTQVFAYNPQRIDVFRMASGGTLATGSQAFFDISNNSSETGPLRLEVREVLTKADMVLSGRPSMSQGDILESGGQFLVQASTADHRLLRLSPRVKLGFATPVPAQLSFPAGISLYMPDQPGDLNFHWVPATDTASSVQTSVPLVAGDPIFFRCLIAKGLYDSNNGWLSFAQPLYAGTPRTTVRVHTDQPSADANSSAVYLVFRDYNAVAQLSAVGAGDFELANVPTQTAVTVFALHSVAGKIYLGQRTDLVQVGYVFNVALTEQSLADVAAQARRLP